MILAKHAIHRVTSFRIEGPHKLSVRFDDDSEQTIDFRPVLFGELFGPLRDAAMFNRVRIDPEAHTLVWPNDADFDPATLHDWPEYVDAMSQQLQGQTTGSTLAVAEIRGAKPESPNQIPTSG